MRYQAILFDMDGVLICSEELTAKAAILALRDFGVEAKAEDFAPFVGQGDDRYVGCVAQLHGKEYQPAMKERMYDYFSERVCSEAILPEGVKDVLFTLKSRGYRLAVCSSADRRKVEANLKAIGVTDAFFDAVLTGSEVSKKKPDPEIYLRGAEAVGEMPEHCLVVEDAPSGLAAAHRGGMDVVGITSSFPREVLCRDETPDYLVEKFSDLLTIL